MIDAMAVAVGGIGRMRYGEAVAAAASRLAPVADTPRLDAELMLAHAAGCARSVAIAFPERELDSAAARRFEALVARREAGEPLAYLVGSKGFHAIELAVGPDVLVPRPETEHLVDAALARLAAVTSPVVLDLGTGSGAIALAVKRARPDAVVLGTDASEAALERASANAARLGLDVTFRVSDWLDGLDGLVADALLCNPPYLPSADPHLAGPLRFEPRAALDGGPDGLYAVRRVLARAPAYLKPDGVLALEHGHDQRAAIVELAGAAGFDVLEAGRDLAGHDRYVLLRR